MSDDSVDQRIGLKHPMQPVGLDGRGGHSGRGVMRFKPNAIVQFLLDNGPFDMNALARLPFSAEDRMQFAQLIGYSVCGYGDLSYVSDESCDEADAAAARALGMTLEEYRR